jgi:hypothetical protein
MFELSMPPTIILWLLADVFENIVRDTHPEYHSVQYGKQLTILEQRLESMLNGSQVRESERWDLAQILTAQDREYANLELYRLAALIYLERASRNFSGTSAKIDAWSRAALQIIEKMKYCKHIFPVFIIACEARTDEQRIIVLDCIHNAVEIASSQSLQTAEEMIHRAWGLDDLETEHDVSYLAKLDLIMSVHETMPSFA